MSESVRLAAMLLLLASTLPAAAEDKAVARRAFSEGTRYYDLGQYAEALEAFKRAYWNYEEPSFLFNIAQCHRALNHKKESDRFIP
jgi:tetratricopeptide (TPR) repeat protein